MNQNHLIFFMLPLILVPNPNASLLAQPDGSEHVAVVNHALRRVSEKKYTRIEMPTDLIRLRHPQEPWRSTQKFGDPLFWGDSLWLQAKTMAKLKSVDPNRKISLVLNADPSVPSKELGRIQFEREGRYVVQKSLDENRIWGIQIMEGTVTAEVRKGPIEMISGHQRIAMDNGSTTRALFIANADSTGMIYLEKGKPGTLIFLDSLEFDRGIRGVLLEVEIAQIEHDKVTRIFRPEAAAVLLLRKFIRYNHKIIWWPPWVIPGAVGLGAGTSAKVIKEIIEAYEESQEQDVLPKPPGHPDNN